MDLLFTLILSLLPNSGDTVFVDQDPPHAHSVVQSNAFSYKLTFNESDALTRYGSRFEQKQMGTLIRNTHITPRDLNTIVGIINQKDIFRGGLNDKYSPGVGSTGVRFKKRPQELMYDLDPDTPLSEDVGKSTSSNATRGYSTSAYIEFKGLEEGDTITLTYNRGRGTEREYERFLITSQNLSTGGSVYYRLFLGDDLRTSSELGVLVSFGEHKPRTRFDSGTASYKVEIERTVKVPGTPSNKPLRRRRN